MVPNQHYRLGPTGHTKPDMETPELGSPLKAGEDFPGITAAVYRGGSTPLAIVPSDATAGAAAEHPSTQWPHLIIF